MADNSFGLKELNLIGSGTPKIESPNNINLSAVTVAISTNATVGGTLDVNGHTELDYVNISGITTCVGGFVSDSGDPVKITVSGTTLTFTVGSKSASLTLS
tara:strand:+ start:116 stop:418 length:303 start_codon:yes stop_codon:yes gene_type:complete